MSEEPQGLSPTTRLVLAAARAYAALPGVVGVAAGGSLATGREDARSDIDLYVVSDGGPPPVAARRAVVEALGGARRLDLDQRYWDTTDYFTHVSGVELDVMFWDAGWVEDRLAAVLDRHEPSIGYTTAHWYTVRHWLPVADDGGWVARARERASAEYPEELRTAVVAHGWPLLRGTLTALPAQVGTAAAREDLVALNHRVAALLAVVHDVVLAANRQPHPGEKRLGTLVPELCASLPEGFTERTTAVLRSAAEPAAVVGAVTALVDALEAWLRVEVPGVVEQAGPRSSPGA
ncbi:MAG: nucleotidyltransferase domain-containing protein [Actinomycetaceae bacterium]